MPLRALDGLGGLEGLAANEGGGGAGHRRVRSGPDHGRGGAERGEGGGELRMEGWSEARATQHYN